MQPFSAAHILSSKSKANSTPSLSKLCMWTREGTFLCCSKSPSNNNEHHSNLYPGPPPKIRTLLLGLHCLSKAAVVEMRILCCVHMGLEPLDSHSDTTNPCCADIPLSMRAYAGGYLRVLACRVPLHVAGPSLTCQAVAASLNFADIQCLIP